MVHVCMMWFVAGDCHKVLVVGVTEPTHTHTHTHTHTQWIKVQPTGLVHFKTKDDGYHYSWNKPHTTVHNLILGSLWADHVSQLVL